MLTVHAFGNCSNFWQMSFPLHRQGLQEASQLVIERVLWHGCEISPTGSCVSGLVLSWEAVELYVVGYRGTEPKG